jgi:hypothetical protein
MTKSRRGDVVLVLFPNSDVRTAKRRPALVLQRDELGTGHHGEFGDGESSEGVAGVGKVSRAWPQNLHQQA